MPRILANHDLKTLVTGVAGVAVIGLLLGAVAKPNLDEHEAFGPQMQTAGGGVRGAPGGASYSVAAYGAQTPDYVMGTDWTRPPAVQYADAGPVDEDDTDVTVLAADDAPQPTATRTTWREEPRGPVVYPSQSGGVPYEANLPPPPAAPNAVDETDEADTVVISGI